MYTRLLDYIVSNNIFYRYQFGFREKKHSPNLAMIYMIYLDDKISDALHNGEYVLGLYLDFSKAFDTVNHGILLNKLRILWNSLCSNEMAEKLSHK